MSAVLFVVLVLLSLSAALALYRVLVGPSILDRVVASEVLLIIVMLGLLTDMVARDHTRTLPAVMVVALLGFTAAVSVARFVSSQEPDA